ncbi:MAG: hypothetical protein H6628_08550 [Calditrichae bacterium]|nr:hypothetical protein [Calditrichia bacterium]
MFARWRSRYLLTSFAMFAGFAGVFCLIADHIRTAGVVIASRVLGGAAISGGTLPTFLPEGAAMKPFRQLTIQVMVQVLA